MNKFLKQSFRWQRIAVFGTIIISSLIHSIDGYTATDAALYDRLRRLEEELRCLVCQNQSLADSNADLANDLRREVEALARQGKNDQEIIAFLKERYGDFVSYRPPFKAATILLWVGPILFFAIGLGGIVIYARQRHVINEGENLLSPEETAHANALLGLDDSSRIC